MRIVGLADIHGNTGMLERMADELAAADVVVLIGDITHTPEGGGTVDECRVITL